LQRLEDPGYHVMTGEEMAKNIMAHDKMDEESNGD
jgi:hypothetical protein